MEKERESEIQRKKERREREGGEGGGGEGQRNWGGERTVEWTANRGRRGSGSVRGGVFLAVCVKFGVVRQLAEAYEVGFRLWGCAVRSIKHAATPGSGNKITDAVFVHLLDGV